MQKQLGRVMNRARIKSLFKRLPPGSYSLSSFVFANHLLTGITKTFLSFISLFQRFFVILEDFYNLFIYKRFERKDKIEVTNWQPYLFLRFAVSCGQSHSY